jgi:hypothetical protein
MKDFLRKKNDKKNKNELMDFRPVSSFKPKEVMLKIYSFFK